MSSRAAALAAVVGLAAAPAYAESADRWTIALELAATTDRMRTGEGDSAAALRGSGIGATVTVARQISDSQWYAQGALSARIAGNLVRDAADEMQPLPEAALFFAGLGGGVAWRSASKWEVGATVGPAMAAYVSPRAIGLSDIGIGLDVAATRSFSVSRSWSIDVNGRASFAAVGDGAQTLWSGALGLGVAGRVGW